MLPATGSRGRRRLFSRHQRLPPAQLRSIRPDCAVDQTATLRPTARSSAGHDRRAVAQSGDIRLSSEIRLVGADPFAHRLGPVEPSDPGRISSGRAGRNRIAAVAAESPAAASAGVADEPGADWSPKPLADLSTNIVLPGGVLPRDYWTERAPQHMAFFDPCGTTRGWPVNTFNWVASCFCSNPLYFEEINLERYGYGCGCFGPCCSSCVQSAVSAAHFFGTSSALPYKMARRLSVRVRLHARPLPAGQLPAVALSLLLARELPGRPLEPVAWRWD